MKSKRVWGLLILGIGLSFLLVLVHYQKEEPPAPADTRTPEEVAHDELVDRVRSRTFTALNLDPGAGKWPLNAKVCGGHERLGYRIENVSFESEERVYVTGNLYLPEGLTSIAPGVLILPGQSGLRDKADPDIQRMCVNLARRGIAALVIDTFGQTGERRVLGGEYSNNRKQRGKRHLLIAAGVVPMGWRVRDTLRAVDYLAARSEVDPARIGIAGAAQGASQAVLAAVMDERILAVAALFLDRFAVGNPDGAIAEIVPGLLGGEGRSAVLRALAPRPLLIMETRDPQENGKPGWGEVRIEYEALSQPDRFSFKQVAGKQAYTGNVRNMTAEWFARWLGTGPGGSDDGKVDLFSPEELNCYESGRIPQDALTLEEHARSLLAEGKQTLSELDTLAKWIDLGATQDMEFKSRYLDLPPRYRVTKDMIREVYRVNVDSHRTIPSDRALVLVKAGLDKPGPCVIYPVMSCDRIRSDWETLRKLLYYEYSLLVVNLDALFGQMLPGWSWSGSARMKVLYQNMVAEVPIPQLVISVLNDVTGILYNLGTVASSRIGILAGGDLSVQAMLVTAFNPDLRFCVTREPYLTLVPWTADAPPLEVLLPGILRFGDIPHIAALIAPRKLVILGGKLPGSNQPSLRSKRISMAFTRGIYGMTGYPRNLYLLPQNGDFISILDEISE